MDVNYVDRTSPIANEKTEFEITFNLKTISPEKDISNLRAIAKAVAAMGDEDVTKVVCDKRYYEPSGLSPTARFSKPLTWYMDTEALTLRQNSVNYRMRTNLSCADFFQLAVKGNPVCFNGPGGLARHEDELESGRVNVNPASFFDPVSKNLMKPAAGHDMYHYFATQVDRTTLPILMTTSNGKYGLAEFAFDEITYIAPGKERPLEVFHRLCQIEAEFVNPGNHKELARELGLPPLTPAEIEDLLHNATDLAIFEAARLGVALEPSDDSKGCIGFKELARHQGRERAQPPCPIPIYACSPF